MEMGQGKGKFVWIIIGVSLIVGGTYLYTNSPKISAYGYVFAHNRHQFEKAYSYFNQDAIEKKFSKEEIITVLEEQAIKNGHITSKDLGMVRDSKTKKWYVKFPYSLQNIYIAAPVGARVSIDNKKEVQKVVGKGVLFKEMLPGKYTISIAYYDQMYPTFMQTIDLPQENKVVSPYRTYDISVIAPPGTWVKLGPVTRHNTSGEVIFENILPGQYDISIITQDKEIVLFSKKLQIEPGNLNVHMDKIKASQELKDHMITFFKDFNGAYKEGIIDQDASFLYKFLGGKINEDLISDFKMWYIDKKDIKDAKSLMEVRDVYPLTGNQVEASVLETVYLTNLEKDGGGQSLEQVYRVVIEWRYKLLREDSRWQIQEREIVQSIVAYKNEKGSWVKY